MIFKRQFKILNRIYGIAVMLRSRKFSGQEVFGFANNTIDGKYVMFLDYDGDVPLKNIKVIVKNIQDSFSLSDIYIFKTNRGHHCICPDKITLDQYLAILNMSYCCKDFRKTPLLFGYSQWTLRLTEKNGKKPKLKKDLIKKCETDVLTTKKLFEMVLQKKRIKTR